jgi:Tol biopolymer transport system component
VPRARILGLAALLAVLSGAASGAASTPSRIVFAADLAPAVTGEIYRLDPNGRRANLSKSPFQDTQPVVSTDGKHVAFFSNRSGGEGVYEVGSDGGGLVRVARPRHLGFPAQLAWQPHGSVLAVSSSGPAEPSGEVWIVQPHRRPIAVSRRFGFGTLGIFGTQQPWSPDGRVLLVWAGAKGMRAVTPQGRTLWTAYADQPIAAWSPHGLLAVPIYHGAAVYDEAGKRLFTFRLPTSDSTFAWSPDGRHLAAFWSGRRYALEVRTADGKFVLGKRNVPNYQIAWAGNSEVVIGAANCSACGAAVGVDIRTGKESQVSSGWLEPLSADRKLAVVTPASGSGFSLGVVAPGGGPTSVYEQIGGCFGDGDWMPAVSSLQFAGRTRSLVYQSWSDCDAPFSNLYSMTSSGVDVRRLTNGQAQETQPAISPDGSEIAYVWASGNGTSCKGCSDGVRIASADGTELHTLTNPEDCTFDDSPTWSPDGRTILFTQSSCDGSSPKLYTVPATGGAVHELGVVGIDPAWGPSRIAYDGGDRSDRGLWSANPDGSDPVKVSATGRKPAWSSNGRLAYLVGSSATIVVVGSSRLKLPFAAVESVAWSPDGTRFVVVARKQNAPAYDIYTVKTDGTGLRRFTWNYGVLGASWR